MEKKPSDIIRKANWRQLTPAVTAERRSELAEYSRQWPDYAAFFRGFSVGRQAECGIHPEGCYLADTPTLPDLRDLYGKDQAVSWLNAQFTYTCNCLGHAFVGGSEEAMRSYLLSLLAGYTYLKASEWMLFFSRLASGQYGRIYGDITPDYMTEALRQFLRQRNGEIDRYERQLRERMESTLRREGAVTYEQYRRMLEAGFLGDPQLRDIYCNTKCAHYANGTCPYDTWTDCPRYKTEDHA